MGSDSWYVPKICNENDCSVFTRRIMWFWNLTLYCWPVYTAWSIVNWVKSSMPISVSQTILWYVSLFFILQKYRVWLLVQSQWQKLEWLSLGTPLKVLIAFWGVFSRFGHIAGNIYFALLPVEEDTAALHVLILHRHCAAHLAAPAQ